MKFKNLKVITTQSCPKCPAFKQECRELSDKVTIQFVDDTHDAFMGLVVKHDLTAAPAAILYDEDNVTVLLVTDSIEEIKKILE